MIFVNTSLEVALKRNQERTRSLPEDILTKSWKDVQNNLGKFQGLFGSNFALVHNDKDLAPNEIQPAFSNIIKTYANKWVTEPVKNPIAKQWVKDQLKLKKAGVK